MKFLKTKKEGIGRAYSDDKAIRYGLYGQVGVLLESGILEEVSVGKEKYQKWIFLKSDEIENGDSLMYDTKDELKQALRNRFEPI